MRAKIIQYNPTAGTGVASADGQQYDFTIRQWQSDSAPTTGQAIELTLENGNVSAIFAVPGDVIAREKASQFASQVGAQLSVAGAPDGLLKQSIDYLGVPVLVAYAVYLLSVTAFNAVSINVFGMKQGFTFWNIADFAGQMGGGGGIRFLLILAIGSIVVPALWRDRRAWFALLLPIAPLLKLTYDTMSAMGAAKSQMKGFGEFGSAMGNAISNAISVDLGGYGAGITAVVLAFFALKRAFGGAQEKPSPVEMAGVVDTTPVPPPPESAMSVAVAVACKACQTPFDAGSLFCGNCGQKL